jgi:flagellar basal-body rod protein FlgC
MEVIAANMANRDAVEDANGNYAPFRRRIAVFAPGDPLTGKEQGVHVSDIMLDTSPLRPKWEPGHKHADAQGYVYYPNIDPAMEMVNALEATRAYEANITAAEATKSMIQSALRLMA